MGVTLTVTWDPRGELARIVRHWGAIRGLFAHCIFVVPPHFDDETRAALLALDGVRVERVESWEQGRYRALALALETGDESIFYADMDRLIRWAETRFDELAQTVAQLDGVDCLVIGRTERANKTHPEALALTEVIINRVASAWVGQVIDCSSGAKGFSRRLTAFLVANSSPSHGLGTDTEWLVLAHRGGFALTPCLVDGLDWETADRFREFAADDDLQRSAALAYDEDVPRWRNRVLIADAIIAAGLDALARPLVQQA